MTQPLLIRLTPFVDESLSGFVVRLAEINLILPKELLKIAIWI